MRYCYFGQRLPKTSSYVRRCNHVFAAANFTSIGLNVLPEALVSRIIWEPLHLPAWLGKALVFLYWPVLGAVVGVCRHWLLWSVVALGIHIGILVLIFYELSQGKLMF